MSTGPFKTDWDGIMVAAGLFLGGLGAMLGDYIAAAACFLIGGVFALRHGRPSA